MLGRSTSPANTTQLPNSRKYPASHTPLIPGHLPIIRSYPAPTGYPAYKERATIGNASCESSHIFVQLDSRFRGNERGVGEDGCVNGKRGRSCHHLHPHAPIHSYKTKTRNSLRRVFTSRALHPARNLRHLRHRTNISKQTISLPPIGTSPGHVLA